MAKPRRAPSKSLDDLGVPAEAMLPKGASYALGQRPASVEAEVGAVMAVMAAFADPVMRECLKRELSAAEARPVVAGVVAGRAKAAPQ